MEPLLADAWDYLCILFLKISANAGEVSISEFSYLTYKKIKWKEKKEVCEMQVTEIEVLYKKKCILVFF